MLLIFYSNFLSAKLAGFSLVFPLLLLSSYLDFTRRRIPNPLNFSLLAASLALNYANNTLAHSLYILAFSLSFSIALWFFGAWSGGDAKLYSILSSLIPVFAFPSVFLAIELFLTSALLLALFLLAKSLLEGKRLLSTTGMKTFFESGFKAMALNEIKPLKNSGQKYLCQRTRVSFAHFLAIAFAITVLF